MMRCDCGRPVKSDTPSCAIRPLCRGTTYVDGSFNVGHTHVNGRRHVPDAVEVGDYFCLNGTHHDLAT